MSREDIKSLEFAHSQIVIGIHNLGEIVPDYQDRISNPDFLSQTLRQWSTFVDAARVRNPNLKNEHIERAEKIARYLNGQSQVAKDYFAGLDAVINGSIKPEHDEAGRFGKGWSFEGRSFSSREEARGAAAAKILADRSKELEEIIVTTQGKVSRGEALTEEESGRYIAAHTLYFEGGHDLVVAAETGKVKKVGEEIRALESATNSLAGLDGREAKEALESARKWVPEPELIGGLVGKAEIVMGLAGKPTTFLGEKLAQYLSQTVEETTGRKLTPRELVTGSGLDLPKTVEERIRNITDSRIEQAVVDWFIGDEKRSGGLMGLKTELNKAKVSEEVLTEWASRHGGEQRLRALMALDFAYRENAPKLVATDNPRDDMREVVDKTLGAAGTITLSIDGDTAAILVKEAQRIDPEALRKRFKTETIPDPFWREIVKRERLLFGLEAPRDTKFKGLIDYPGFPNYIRWCMTDRGARTATWIEGDEIDPKKLLTLSEYLRLGTKNAADSLGLEKAFNRKFSRITELAFSRDEARRIGINLREFAEEIRDKSELEIEAKAEEYCRAVTGNHTPEAIETLIDHLVRISPYILRGTDGLFDRTLLIPMVASGEARLDYGHLPDRIRSDLFKHFDSRTKWELLSVVYHDAYDPFLDKIVGENVGQGKDIQAEILKEVRGPGQFYAMEIYALTGINFFEASWEVDVADFLANRGGDLANFAEQLRRGELKLTDLPSDAVKTIMMGMGIDVSGPLPEKTYDAWRAYMDKMQLELAEKFGLVARTTGRAKEQVDEALARIQGMSHDKGFLRWLEAFSQHTRARLGAELYSLDLYKSYLRLSNSDPVMAFIARVREAATVKWEREMKGLRATHGGELEDEMIFGPSGEMGKWRNEGLIRPGSPEEERIIEAGRSGLTSQEGADRNTREKMTDRVARWFNDKIYEGAFRWLWTAEPLQFIRGIKIPVVDLPIGEFLYKVTAPRPRAVFVLPIEIAISQFIARVPWKLTNLLGFPEFILKIPAIGPQIAQSIIYPLERTVYFNLLGINVGSFLVFGIGGTWLHWRVLTWAGDWLYKNIVRKGLQQYPPRMGEQIPGFKHAPPRRK